MSNRVCPKCRENGHDSTGDHLYLMRDKTQWICIHKEYHTNKQFYFEGLDEQPTEHKMFDRKYQEGEFDEIGTFKSSANSDRSISKETAVHFGVVTGFSESTRQPESIFYPMFSSGDLVAYKKRKLPKGFHVVSDRKMKGVPVEFFGQSVCPLSNKKLLITGGEEDALAAYEMLRDKYPKFKPSVVSLPNGENLNCVSANKEFLANFEEILICTDMDDAGKKASDALCKQIGERCRVVTLTEKDASDMKVKGKDSDFINAFFRAREYRPSTIILIEDITEEIIKPMEWGLTYPFPALTQLTYGLKWGGEIIGIGAGPGAGKSTLMHQIESHIIFAHSESIAIFDIEEGAVMAAKHLIGGIINKPIHKPDCIYDQEKAREAVESVAGKVEFFDGHPEWDEVRDNIRYFASKGVRFFFLDPISALVAHLSASEGNEVLGTVMKDLMKFRKELGLTFFHVNHLNNPAGGKDHGAGAKVYGSQFSGSRAMWKYSTSLWGLQRNQLSEDEEEKNTVILSVIKDRLGGNTGSFELKYSREKGILEETKYEI